MTDRPTLASTRRTLLGAGLAATLLPQPLLAQVRQSTDRSPAMPIQNDGYTFPLSADVTRTSVRYRNRYGIEIAGDVYRAKSMNGAQKHSALVVGPPHGGVKEQGAGIYAQEMAKRGFVALAFDPSYNGESGGEPRHVTSPELFAEDFSAGVDFLGTLPDVDRDRIGAIGICGSGGFALSQACVDTRIKAVATSALYDISRVMRNGWEDGASEADRRKSLNDLAAQRWSDVDRGAPQLQPTFPARMPAEGPDPITLEFWEYYVADRGHHPRSIGGFTLTSGMSHINFGQMRNLADLAPRPVLVITGDQAHSRYMSETVHQQIAQSELIVVPGARHIDLYDRVDLIPFDRLDQFFSGALTA